MKIQAIRGFRDILPEEMPWWRKVETEALAVLTNFGFQEMRIPVVEKTQLFARSIGADTDIVEKEMFTFPDRHDDLLSLRPEATAGVVRAFIEHSLGSDGRPLKLFFIGPMFRYERPQKGRQRQFHQINVEVFNEPSPHMDAEVLTMLNHFLNRLDLENVTMHINSLGCRECRPEYKRSLQAFLKDRRGDLCPDCQRRMDVNPLRVVDCKVPACADIVKDAPEILDTLCGACRDHFDVVRQDLERAKVPYVLNPRLVRGLDYYTRTTFEARTGALGAQNAVAGGGRYDGLVDMLGGGDVPGLGFAIGMERLVMLMSESGRLPVDGPDLFIAALDDAGVAQAFPLAQDLRRSGLKVEMDYSPGSLKSRMKRAGKLNASSVLILGPDEIERGEAILRNMSTKDQTGVALESAAAQLTALLKKGEAN